MQLSAYVFPLVFAAMMCWLLLLAITSLIEARRANARAEQLVRRILSPLELDQLDRYHYLDVPSRRYADRVYRIPAREGTVLVLHRGVKTLGLCIRPIEQLAGREHVLAHKGMLEAAEDEYLKRANIIFGRRDALSSLTAAPRE
jgi:hypothetical protein